MKKALLAASLVCAAGMASAYEYDSRIMLTPSIDFHALDGGKQLGSDIGFGLALGKFVSDNWSIDFEFDTASFDAEVGNGDIDQYGLGVMARYHWGEPGSLRPFFGFGLGYIDHDASGDYAGMSSNGTMGQLALGLRKKVSERVGFQTQIKYRMDGDDSIGTNNSYDDYIFGIALNIALGANPATEESAPLVEPGVVDSDGDGVSDPDDRCPNTPAGAEVDMYGCELDSDGDGVVNSKDECPGTRAGAVVDEVGCEVEVVIELQGVHFDFDKASLKDESYAILDAAVSTLSEHGKIAVEVAGHTDSVGSESYNQDLSERRAAVVKEYLVSKGISADRLTSKGYGESSPVADNSTDEGRAQNRRTELIIQD